MVPGLFAPTLVSRAYAEPSMRLDRFPNPLSYAFIANIFYVFSFKVFPSSYGLVDIRLEEIFELNTHYKTRNNGLKLKLPYANIDARKYSFAVRTVNIWNSLPRNIVLSPTLDKFKDELNTDFCHHLLNKHINGRAFKCR
jgi:hypothetical protein